MAQTHTVLVGRRSYQGLLVRSMRVRGCLVAMLLCFTAPHGHTVRRPARCAANACSFAWTMITVPRAQGIFQSIVLSVIPSCRTFDFVD